MTFGNIFPAYINQWMLKTTEVVVIKALVNNIAHKNVIKDLQWTLSKLIDGWISFVWNKLQAQ